MERRPRSRLVVRSVGLERVPLVGRCRVHAGDAVYMPLAVAPRSPTERAAITLASAADVAASIAACTAALAARPTVVAACTS